MGVTQTYTCKRRRQTHDKTSTAENFHSLLLRKNKHEIFEPKMPWSRGCPFDRRDRSSPRHHGRDDLDVTVLPRVASEEIYHCALVRIRASPSLELQWVTSSQTSGAICKISFETIVRHHNSKCDHSKKRWYYHRSNCHEILNLAFGSVSLMDLFPTLSEIEYFH